VIVELPLLLLLLLSHDCSTHAAVPAAADTATASTEPVSITPQTDKNVKCAAVV
jgi:hypothetical protein